ncbi:MAG: hypothetical protein CMA70_04775 [Euryarchaeota archaeon]|nr:hypothetical protein [Euryarchaeota archaeon]
MSDIFLDLKTQLEKELRSTGFNPTAEPPLKEEPEITASLSELPLRELKDLYDCYLVFYGYLTDQITRCLCFLEVTKARQALQYAEAMKRAHSDKSLTNADIRKASVETNVEYIKAKRDYLYFKQLLAAHEERRRKMSKSMDRVGRELWLRTQDRFPSSADIGSTSSYVKHRYRKTEP